MNKYLRLEHQFIRLSISKMVAYQGNFVSSIVTSLVWAIFSVLSIMLLTVKNPVIFSWTRDDLLILTGVYSIIIGIFHVLFSRNMEQISRIVHRGQLDGVLSKPVDVQFYLSCAIVNISGIPRVIGAIFFVTWLVWKIHLVINVVQIGFFIILGGAGLVLLYSIWYAILTLTIWQSQLFNLSDFLFHLTDTAKYPTEMYHEFKYFITVFLLPIALVVTLPTKAFLNRINIVELILFILLTGIIFAISRILGKFALRFYTGTG